MLNNTLEILDCNFTITATEIDCTFNITDHYSLKITHEIPNYQVISIGNDKISIF